MIGDVGRGVFVRPGIPEFMRDQAVPAADIITPNQFELDYLSGIATDRLAAAQGRRRGRPGARPEGRPRRPRCVTEETPADSIDLVAADGGGLWRVRTPRLDLSVNGAGDAIAALFFVH